MTSTTPGPALDLVRTIWCDVLELEEVADDVNFYAVGGDSLKLIAVVERLRLATGHPVRMADALHAGTVEGHAGLLADSTS